MGGVRAFYKTFIESIFNREMPHHDDIAINKWQGGWESLK
jgi:hypothetical protein